MGTMDMRRNQPRDLLLRRSVSSSSILKTANKMNRAQRNQHAFTEVQSHPRNSVRNLLQAMPPPPLLEDSERVNHNDNDCDNDNGVMETSTREQLLLSQESSSRRVSFSSSKSKCVYIEPPTPSQKNALFYSKEDYKRIYNENIDTIKTMEAEKKYPASETHYYRGLLVSRARYEREQRIKFVVSKVLQEQEKKKTLCEEWIKEFSQHFSSQTTIAALYLGKIDAMAAGVSSSPLATADAATRGSSTTARTGLSQSLHAPKRAPRRASSDPSMTDISRSLHTPKGASRRMTYVG
ncbi:unnamed protein product [Cylindrotheca closterium]|uniref:Uncharacterized protein n=1 Tax=Cylindrotheca closterium TaxID=2856 RepID=A0AAD2G8S1_9STRA|nr:unnamed protein product [Cylindrotheca closterium]